MTEAMTKGKRPAISKPAKHLLALNPSEEADFKKKVQAVKKRPSKGPGLNPGVIYVGHLPIGLDEIALRKYFEQFGSVLRLQLSRSKRTGGSKGFGFVEFECDEVAQIVAETMNNYLMGERLIKCHVMPPEKVHEKLFVGTRRQFKKPTLPAVTRYNKTHTPEEVSKVSEKLLKKESRLRKRLAEKGLEYNFPGFAAQVLKKRSTEVNASICSEDITPACTPSFLERRKSTRVTDDDEDNEIIINAATPAPKSGERGEGEEDESSEGDYAQEDGEEPMLGNEAPAEEEAIKQGNEAPAEEEAIKQGNEAPAEEEASKQGNEAPAEEEAGKQGNEAPAEEEAGKQGNEAPTEEGKAQ